MRKLLPQFCYAFIESAEPGNRIGIIKRGERGYYRTDIDSPKCTDDEVRFIIKYFNGKRGITPAQDEAMQIGSLCGWETPGADPRNWGIDGKPIRKTAAMPPMSCGAVPGVGKEKQKQTPKT